MKAALALFGRPTVLRAFHGWATLAWLVMVPVVALTGLRKSLVFLVAISVYAIVLGHWSSYQASRVEVVQDQQIDEATG